MTNELPIHTDLGMLCSEEDFRKICEAIRLRFANNGNLKVTISYKGPKGDDMFTARVTRARLSPKPSFVVKDDDHGEEHELEAMNLLFIEWNLSAGDKSTDSLMRMSLEFNAEQSLRLSRETECSNEGLKL